MKRTAVVRFLERSEGGFRTVPVVPGYKPHLKIGELKTSCIVTPVDENVKVMHLGVEYEVFLELMMEETYGGEITDCMPVTLYEGDRITGVGRYS